MISLLYFGWQQVQPYFDIDNPSIIAAGEAVQKLTPKNYPGLLGVSLSGAGPSILALATTNFEVIAKAMITIVAAARDIRYDWQILKVDTEGASLGYTEENLETPR